MASRAGYVLTGGRSTRFGADKALADFHGRPMALRVADVVREVAGAVALVGAPDRYRSLGLPVIADSQAGLGPLAGLCAALSHVEADYALVAACDMPNLRPAFLELLFETAESVRACAVVPIQPDGRKQPLCAVYARSMAEPFRRALAKGRRRAGAGLEGLEVCWLTPEAYAGVDPEGLGFRNVNTRSELERSIRQADPRRS